MIGANATSVKAVAVQPDGRIVLAGTLGVTRLMADGSNDYSFGYHGTVFTAAQGATNFVRAVAIQPDGRILVAGSVPPYVAGRPPSFWLTRYLPNGTVDTTFGSDGVVKLEIDGYLFSMALQPDGKILAGGNGLVRLLPSGALDAGFGSGGILHPLGTITAFTLQPDGKIVGGMTMNGSTYRTYDFGILRLHPDGSPDEGFGSRGLVTYDTGGEDYLTGIAVDPSGRIVSAGSVGINGRYGVGLTRHLANGGLDPTFGDGGLTVNYVLSTTDLAAGLVLGSDGKVVVAGTVMVIGPVNTQTIALVRFDIDGRIDPAFGDGGKVAFSGRPLFASALVSAPGGDLIVGGGTGEHGGLMTARLRGTGSTAPGPVTATNCNKQASLKPLAATDSGSWAVGTRSVPNAFSFTSTGTAPVRVDRVGFSNDNNGQFVVVSDRCSGTTVAPGSSCQILVSYAPTFAGYSTPVLLAWDNADDGSHDNQLQGRGHPVFSPSASGWNGLGAVGAGPPDYSAVPAQVNLPGTASVAAGYLHSLAVKADGTVWAWGWNGFGQLGDGTIENRPRPVRVPGLTNIAMVVAGAYQSYAVTRDGAVLAWGLNHVGQLGDGTTVDHRVPVRIGGLPPIRALSSGAFHTLALADDGTVWAWGWNAFGQLGDGTTGDRHAPEQLPGLPAIHEIAAGAFHSVAVTSPGWKVLSWGLNHVGQLGDGTTVDHHEPTPVPGLDGVRDIAAGAYHTVALYDFRPVRAWGWNAFGQLGDGTTVDRHSPVVVAMDDSVQQVSAGLYDSFALTSDGTVKGWGSNAFGQLGNGGTAPAETIPTARLNLKNANLIAAGGLHSLAG